jgi:uncharacterized protein (DUF2126 family)
LIPVKIECHSGFKADEYTKYIYHHEKRLEIQQIFDRWYQGESNPEWLVSNYFKVDTIKDFYQAGLVQTNHTNEKPSMYFC